MTFNWDEVRDKQAGAGQFDSENIFSTYGRILKISRRGQGSENIILRLMAQEDDCIPIITTHEHRFKVGSKHKSFFCYKNVEKPCPVCEQSKRMYAADKNGNWYSLRSKDTVQVNVLVTQADNRKLVGKVYVLQLDEYQDRDLVKLIYSIKNDPFSLENGNNLNICATAIQKEKFTEIQYTGSHWEDQSPINVDGLAITSDVVEELQKKLNSFSKYISGLTVPDVKEYVKNIRDEAGVIIELEMDKMQNVPLPAAVKPAEAKPAAAKAVAPEPVPVAVQPTPVPVAAAAKVVPSTAEVQDDGDFEFMQRLAAKKQAMITAIVISSILALGSIYWGLAYRKKKIIQKRLSERLKMSENADVYRANQILWLRLNDILQGMPITEDTENEIRLLKQGIAKPEG